MLFVMLLLALVHDGHRHPADDIFPMPSIHELKVHDGCRFRRQWEERL
jgi:hypothetical protein